MSDKHYPTNPDGAADTWLPPPAKPCLRRLNTIPLSWCVLPDGHELPCCAPVMRQVEEDDLGPGASKRRRF